MSQKNPIRNALATRIWKAARCLHYIMAGDGAGWGMLSEQPLIDDVEAIGMAARCPEVRVHLLGGFRVTSAGTYVEIPASTHRLVAFLAIQQRPVERAFAAGSLWLEKSELRAQANLRSALWRLRQSVDLVIATPTHIRLAPTATVDLASTMELARRLIDERVSMDLEELDERILGASLLPEWYDDFIEVERERLRQLQLHALEALARRLNRAGSHARAVDAALTAVATEPLRESAHRTVIEIHLAEGNKGEALRQFDLLSRILDEQLGLRPSRDVAALVGR
jgi:DNA-binding SARP family transcriptional activator